MRAALLAMLATSVLAPFAQADVGGPCPRGANYVATIPEVRGACAVAFDGAAIVACAPEQVGGSGQDRQLVRANVAADGTGASPSLATQDSGCAFAADIAVSSDGTIAIADAAGGVRLIARDGVAKVVGDTVVRAAIGVAWRGSQLAVSDRATRSVIVLNADGSAAARLGAGQLGEPRGLTATADGSIFVADRLGNCIWHFAADAKGALAPQGRRIGERGANPGQFNAPCDVAAREFGGTTCLLVADELNHRVQILDATGAFVGFFGMHALIPRQGEGRIHYPRSVAVSADGATVAVAEPFEDRLQVFTLVQEPGERDPAYAQFEFITSHFGPKVACETDLLVLLDLETQGVALLDARTTPPIHMSIIGGAGAMAGRFGEVSAFAVEPVTGRVWVADCARGRIDVFNTAWDRTKDPVVDMFIPQLARSMDLARLGSRIVRMPEIADIAFETRLGQPSVLLLDRAGCAILRTDARLSSLETIALPEAARAPEELALASDGRIAVADPVARRVFLRSAAGDWTTLDRLGDIAFARPVGVGFDEHGQLVVSDNARDACIVSNADGTARLVGERGGLDEQFFGPEAIAPSPKGLIVVDRGNHRFQRFGEGFQWNLTGSMGRYYDKKRKGSPGAAPASTPETRTRKEAES